MLVLSIKPPNKHQLELINKIWDQLDLLFGKERAKKDLKIYIEDNDHSFKGAARLAMKLQELRQLVEKRDKDKKKNSGDGDPELLLPGAWEDGPSPEIM